MPKIVGSNVPQARFTCATLIDQAATQIGVTA
jgi:hypothetical protein